MTIGSGTILQIIYEVTRLLLKDSARTKTPALGGSPPG